MNEINEIQQGINLFKLGLKFELNKEYKTSLQHYLLSAELLLKAKKSRKFSNDLAFINKYYNSVLLKAKHLNNFLFLLNHSSKVNGNYYHLWSYDSSFKDLKPYDLPSLSLSQLNSSAEYNRLNSFDIYTSNNGNNMDYEIIQDVITDCSIVTSLSVCNHYNLKYDSNLAINSIHPQNDQKLPIKSSDGIYNIKLYFNGSPRLVKVNDELPLDINGNLITAKTSSNFDIWPALIEKAIMSIWRTYEFNGSNSATDLQMITNWIPDHISFSDRKFKQERAWDTLFKGFKSGICLLTLGSKSIKNDMNPQLLFQGFVENHAYAIKDISIDSNNRRYLTISNLWKHSKTYNFDWDYVCDNFDAIYASWDPEIFTFHDQVHFAFKGSKSSDDSNPLERCPRFNLNVDVPSTVNDIQSGDVWILLNRHLKDKNLINKCYSALHVSKSDYLENNTIINEDDEHINSLNILVKDNVTPSNNKFNITISQLIHDNQSIIQSSIDDVYYTLTAFASHPLKLINANKSFLFSQKTTGSWSLRSAGGNCSLPSYGTNPHYNLCIKPSNEKVQLRLALEADEDIPVNIKLIWGSNERIFNIQKIDIVSDSGLYSHKIAILEGENLQARDYTIVLSAFKTSQLSSFQLYADCTVPITLKPIPQEGSGMFASNPISGEWIGSEDLMYAFELRKRSLIRLRFMREHVQFPIEIGIYSLKHSKLITSLSQNTQFNSILTYDALDEGKYRIVIKPLNKTEKSTKFSLNLWNNNNNVELN